MYSRTSIEVLMSFRHDRRIWSIRRFWRKKLISVFLRCNCTAYQHCTI